MRIKEIEARLAAIKQEIEQRGDAMTAAEIDALEQETTQLTEERAGLIAAAEKRNGILDNIAKGAGVVIRTFQQTDNNGGCYYSGQSFRYAGISFRVAEKHCRKKRNFPSWRYVRRGTRRIYRNDRKQRRSCTARNAQYDY